MNELEESQSRLDEIMQEHVKSHFDNPSSGSSIDVIFMPLLPTSIIITEWEKTSTGDIVCKYVVNYEQGQD